MENKSERIMVRLDPKLRKQLQNYADRNDEGMVSTSARKAIKKFIAEQNNK